MMVKLRDGWSTCREHGGEYAGDVGAMEHLQTEHPDLVRRLSAARVIPVPDDYSPPAPNREARRAQRRDRTT